MFASTILDANTRLKMFANSLSNPPTPCSTNELPSRIIRARCACELSAVSFVSGTVFALPLAGPALVARASCPGGADARTARFGFGFSNAGGFSGAAAPASSSKSCVDQSFARHWTPRAFVAVASTQALEVDVRARDSPHGVASRASTGGRWTSPRRRMWCRRHE